MMSTKFSFKHLLVLPLMVNVVHAAGIEEVVVTAQKREQSLQDVSIAVSAFSGDQLRDLGVTSAEEVGNSISGVQVYNFRGKGQPSFVVRGIGTQDFAPNTSPTAAGYLDEVYLGSNVITGFQIFDVAGVEVLKGPQGTLFGRNTTGGAVSYKTRRPTEENEGYIDLGLANYDTKSLEFGFGGPASDKINYRLAGRLSDQGDGYYTNRWSADQTPFPRGARYFNPDSNIGEDQNWALRLLVDMQISDSVSALFNIHGGGRESETLPVTPIGFSQIPGSGGVCQATALSGTSDPRFCGDAFGYSDTDGDEYTVSNDFVGSNDEDNIGSSLRIEADLGSMILTSITAYEDVQKTHFADNDGAAHLELNQIRDIDYDQFSQELRLSSNSDGDLFWMVGAYYSQDSVGQVFCGDLNPFLGLGTECRLDFSQDTETLAVYGHSEYSFSEQLKLTAGLRYTKEDRDFFSKSTQTIPGVGTIIVNFGTQPSDQAFIDDGDQWSNLSGKLALDYRVNDDVLLYASYSRGFKSGGYDGDYAFTRQQLDPYEEEIVSAYELGWKTTLADNTVRLNGALFYYDYQDPQIRVQRVSSAGLPFNQLINLDSASVQGLEMELLWQPTDQLTVMLSASLLDTEFDDPSQPIYDGNTLPLAADESATVLVRYEWPLSNGMSLAAQVDGKYNGEYELNPANVSYLKQDSYFLSNARLTLSEQDGKWDVAVWGKNLTEETFAVQSYSLFGAYPVAYNSPRTYGVNFRYNW